MRRRAAWAGAAALGMAGLAWLLYRNGPTLGAWWPGCTFQRLTGWHCPGCGMTRALHALLHGRVGEAFGFNPLLVALSPVVAAGCALEVLAWVRGPERPTPRLRPGPRTIIGFVVVVVAYWVARNLPWWPCTLLAP